MNPQRVTFNWILERDSDTALQRRCVELEYRLRPRITRFLMERLERDLRGDFSGFYFDVDLVRQEIRISERTPAEYARRVADDFVMEFGLFPAGIAQAQNNFG